MNKTHPLLFNHGMLVRFHAINRKELAKYLEGTASVSPYLERQLIHEYGYFNGFYANDSPDSYSR